MGAAGGIGADEHGLTGTRLGAGQAGEDILDQFDVVGGRIRSGSAWPQ